MNLLGHIASIIIAVAIAVPTSIILKTQPHRPSVSHSAKPTKARVASWGDLDQKEVDALTVELGKLPKAEVAIFCSDVNCEEIAADFENSLESAKWDCAIERPLLNTNIGIGVTPNNASGRALAGAINRATDGRLKVGLIEGSLQPGRLAIVIGKNAQR